MASDEIMTALGRAIAANWGDLPTCVQKDLFEAAVRSSTEKGTREKLALASGSLSTSTPSQSKMTNNLLSS